MQTRTYLPPCADRHAGFAVQRQPAIAPIAAAATLILAFALAAFSASTGWPL